MKIIRTIKKYAGMLVIKLFPKDAEDFGFKVGDKVDISDMIIINKSLTRGNKTQVPELVKSGSNKLKVKQTKSGVAKIKRGSNRSSQ
jgi:hypothetical protein